MGDTPAIKLTETRRIIPDKNLFGESVVAMHAANVIIQLATVPSQVRQLSKKKNSRSFSSKSRSVRSKKPSIPMDIDVIMEAVPARKDESGLHKPVQSNSEYETDHLNNDKAADDNNNIRDVDQMDIYTKGDENGETRGQSLFGDESNKSQIDDDDDSNDDNDDNDVYIITNEEGEFGVDIPIPKTTSSDMYRVPEGIVATTSQ